MGAFACESFDLTLKVIVVGNGQVGKSTMLQRYCKGHFTADYKKTIGTDYMQKKLNIGGEELSVDLWDTAGQEVFARLTAGYYRGAGACALAFSTVDRDSFDAVESWKSKVEEVCGPLGSRHAPVMCLVQTKVDLLDRPEAKIDPGEADQLARKLGVKFFRTSTKENFNVNEMFQYLAEAWMKKSQEEEGGDESAAPIKSDGPGRAKKEGFGEKKEEAAAPAVSSSGGKVDLKDGGKKGKERAKGKKKKCTIL